MKIRYSTRGAVFLGLLCGAVIAAAQDKPGAASPASGSQQDAIAPDESKLVRLSKDDAVWYDPQRKLVVVDGEVALREGFLEMFACPQGTKEHESIVAVYAKAFQVHAALLRVGAKQGRPVQFDPAYRAVEGPVVDVYVLWRDTQGEKHTARAQEWVRNTKTQKEMEQNWVFGGSGFWKDEETGKEHYYADDGDMICLSNFTTAMLDLPIASSQSSDQLMFESFTERIPPKGAKVRLVLIPRLEKKEQSAPKPRGAAKRAAPTSR